jgi:hypothetical protein
MEQAWRAGWCLRMTGAFSGFSPFWSFLSSVFWSGFGVAPFGVLRGIDKVIGCCVIELKMLSKIFTLNFACPSIFLWNLSCIQCNQMTVSFYG